ncbi:hypothetical protein GCM10010406_18500 [Streptomyces thermolineatus]|uniref:Uncharacterized protein n=1 Tax=Streptomyces thermolineatus TaxID=44033 RepID=A0ABP5YLR9_9ACTN
MWCTVTGDERAQRDVLSLLVPGVPAGELPRLRERLGGEGLPRPASGPEPGGDGCGSDDSAPSPAGALRAALAAPRPSGLGPLAAAARKAGPLDDDLALALLERARPARTLPALLGEDVRPDGRTAARLRELAARHPGADPARWRGLHDALATHRGTLPELLAAEPEAAPEPADGPAPLPPRSVPATLALLLEHTAPEQTAAALRALPDAAVRELLAGGSLPGPALTAAVTGHGDSRSRTALAAHPRLDARVLKQLVAADDPAVNAAVYRNPRCTPSLRRAIAHRLDRVPLDEGLRAELLSPGADVPATWHTPLLACGDPELVARALSRGVRRAAQRHALVRVLESRGPDAVRRLLSDASARPHLHAQVRAEAEAALEEPDGAARLRADGEPYDDPAALPRLLRTVRGTSTLRDLLNEPYVHDFPALAAAHRQSPFMPKAAEELLRHEDATDADRADLLLNVLNAPWRTGGRYGGNTAPPARRLADEPLDDAAPEWAEGMARAGLLDPAALVHPARPAARAAGALAALAERGLLTDDARRALHSAARDHLAGRPDAWAALLRMLPGFTGSLAELVAAAGQTAAPGPPAAPDSGTPAGRPRRPGPAAVRARTPGTPELPEPPELPESSEFPDEPRGERQRAALGALDLLIRLAPGDAPLPDDPGSLRYLARHHPADNPGGESPAWLVKACEAAGIAPEDGWHTPPPWAQALAEPARARDADAARHTLETAYLHGVLRADDLLHTLPAPWLVRRPHDWYRLAFPVAWENALAAFLDHELGDDPDAWLRLAAAAREEMRAETRRPPHGATWPELLERSRTRTGAPAPEEWAPMADHAAVDYGPSSRNPAPTTPDEALRLLAGGNHLWLWPLGTLLGLAGPRALTAVLPRLGPDGPWLLAAHLLRHRPTPRAAFDHLLRQRDPQALRVLAVQGRWLDDGLEQRLADLRDPDTDLALLHHTQDRHVRRRVVTAPGPVAGRLLPGLRDAPSAAPPGGALWLESAEPDLIEAVLVRTGRHLDLAQQLTGCLNLLRHGGPRRLGDLVGRGVLGRAATRLCQKALAGPDPAAMLRARLDRELSPARLAARLRRSDHPWRTAELLGNRPAAWDWYGLEAEHHKDPVPHWAEVVRHPAAPRDLVLRHSEHLPAPGRHRTPADPRLTRARLRHGLGDHFHEPLTVQLDHLLGTGHLGGADMVREVAPAALVLDYLNGAGRRTDAPARVGAALAETAVLVRDRLGVDAAAWRRVVARLTERDPHWDPLAPVASLLAP